MELLSNGLEKLATNLDGRGLLKLVAYGNCYRKAGRVERENEASNVDSEKGEVEIDRIFRRRLSNSGLVINAYFTRNVDACGGLFCAIVIAMRYSLG